MTLDIDATVIHSAKRAAKRACDGERSSQPALVLWAEQDLIAVDEFGDGNVPAGMGNLRSRRCQERSTRSACAATVRSTHHAMSWMDQNAISYAISVRLSPQIEALIEALPECPWNAGRRGDRCHP